jgi:hypothetical protein
VGQFVGELDSSLGSGQDSKHFKRQIVQGSNGLHIEEVCALHTSFSYATHTGSLFTSAREFSSLGSMSLN